MEMPTKFGTGMNEYSDGRLQMDFQLEMAMDCREGSINPEEFQVPTEQQSTEHETPSNRPLDHLDEMQRLASELRVAVHRGGGSIDPEENHHLRALLSPLLLPYVQVHGMLKEIAQYESLKQTVGLPIDYGRHRVSIVLKVRTIAVESFKRRLLDILRLNKSRFFKRNVLKHVGIIQAHFLSSDMLPRIVEDTEWFLATESCITDLKNHNVQFKCKPQDLEMVTENLRQRGYEILYTDRGYCTHKTLVDLSPGEMEEYLKFLEKLKQDEDVLMVYDNVRYNLQSTNLGPITSFFSQISEQSITISYDFKKRIRFSI